MSVWSRTANNKSGTGEDFPRAPGGNHVAVCVGIIHMGTQHQEFGGEEKTSDRAFFVWELLNEKVPGTKGNNFLIAIDLNTSLNEKAKLRQWIQARTGKSLPNDADYDITQELGLPCLLNVVEKKTQKDRPYSKVESMAAVPKGMPVGKPQTTPFLWHVSQYDGSGKITLPEWVPYCMGRPLAEVIAECDELKGKIDQSKNGSGGTTRPANSTPPNGTPAVGPGRPPGPGAPPRPADEPELYKVWTPEAEWKLMDATGLRNWMKANQFSAASTYIHLSNQPESTNRPATEFGFRDPEAFPTAPPVTAGAADPNPVPY